MTASQFVIRVWRGKEREKQQTISLSRERGRVDGGDDEDDGGA